ncbi:DUF4249 family protein [Plebeiibacterium marinum]|uniref:DUF4249 domain-containing protein n=1 Tax=Plebeiibacterium marinum TaxID=2992111 RepID=A0AAE3MEK0_9BACT|nr:DUF4249 family protein [Plebeiobacterium marinum]MCW3805607.1 DUF4249 domain-containing protein [Plebeiobacterium marinum]
MKKILYLIICLMIVGYGCIEEQILPYNNLKMDAGYFVECYLEPNNLYKLTATKLQPLNEDYILDYSHSFDAFIDNIELYHSLYSDTESGYIYNYGSYLRFVPKKDKVYLTLISEDQDTIKGETTVPEDIKINNFKSSDGGVQFDFLLSPNKLHNFFMVSIDSYDSDSVYRIVKLLDYSGEEELDTIFFDYSFKDDKGRTEYLDVVLRRLTQDNFKYQQSIENAKDANNDNLILPSPLAGNLKNAIGIFTCYTSDSVSVYY